jgi:hypothetical protein
MFLKWATNIWENVRKLEELTFKPQKWKNANATDHFKSDRIWSFFIAIISQRCQMTAKSQGPVV